MEADQVRETTKMENYSTIRLKVVWPEECQPKWHKELEKALQSWLNKNICNVDCRGVTVQEDGSVKVDISDTSALEGLFTQETKLTLKNQRTALVTRIMPGDRMPATRTADIQKPDGSSSIPLSAPSEKVSCNIPLVHFWYVNQVYREKMRRIEKENRVQIQPDVTVTFNVDPSTGGDPDKALSEFIDLVQSCLGDSNYVTYSPEPGQVDWEKTLKFIQQDQEKLTLIASSHDVDVCGPMKSLKAFESITKMQKKILNAQIPGPSSAREVQGQSYRLNMTFRDPFLSSGLEMDATHFKVMTLAHMDDMAKIQSKFGVNFYYLHDIVRARAEPGTSQDVITLESHALRALLCLYQRVATSVMSCSLLSLSQVNIDSEKLKEMLFGLCGVVPELQDDQWRIIGLPENLRQAVVYIESNLGRPVFKDQDKQMIGCSKAAVDEGCVVA